MNERRMILAGLAAAIATPAFAQNQPNGGMSDAEMQYIKSVIPIGSLSLAISRIAEQKARGLKVKEFAKLETAEQETVADALNALQNPASVSGTIKPPSEQEVQQNLERRVGTCCRSCRANGPGPSSTEPMCRPRSTVTSSC